MAEEFGLSLGVKAPSIETIDIFENTVNSEEILNENRGLLIDFSRGAW